jgi:uncharacterized membrane protein YedE/YeeE
MIHEADQTVPLMPWWAGGLGIGFILLLAVSLVQPIGVSTQYVVLDGVLLHAVFPEVADQSPYLEQTSKDWSLATYEFLFVAGIPIGAFLAAKTTNRLQVRMVPSLWAQRFGPTPTKRLVWSFIGGFLLLFGARFGGGCTSGHMISGISQLAVSSFVFSTALFASAILTARYMYPEREKR